MIEKSEMSSPTSTSSSTDFNPKKMEDKASYRKSSKPLMEKKRRARINSCLTQLKSLVLQATKKDNSQYSKLEKADILELTVKHLKNVQRYQASSSQGSDAISKYRAGFNECASEVMRYLNDSQGVNDQARARILSHLASILTPINSLPLHQAHTPILPAPPTASSSQQLQQPLLPGQFYPPPPQQQQPQQQQHPQHQQQSAFLSPAAVQVSVMDSNNNSSNCIDASNKTLASQPVLVSRSLNCPTLMDLKPGTAVSSSPTAFQSPIVGGVTAPGLQLPCIPTASMATNTPLQLVPGTLPSGQVAFVLAPHSIHPFSLYAPQQARHVAQDTTPPPSSTSSSVPMELEKEDKKLRPPVEEGPVSMVIKHSRPPPPPSAPTVIKQSRSSPPSEDIRKPSEEPMHANPKFLSPQAVSSGSSPSNRTRTGLHSPSPPRRLGTSSRHLQFSQPNAPVHSMPDSVGRGPVRTNVDTRVPTSYDDPMWRPW